mmetsp:Transcript_75537/g.136174  ORF Transcript_75537/g.136174 Transcript_75537/m.136174 type:complete len:230 (-) Transcript_75537:122-811(-)
MRRGEGAPRTDWEVQNTPWPCVTVFSASPESTRAAGRYWQRGRRPLPNTLRCSFHRRRICRQSGLERSEGGRHRLHKLSLLALSCHRSSSSQRAPGRYGRCMEGDVRIQTTITCRMELPSLPWRDSSASPIPGWTLAGRWAWAQVLHFPRMPVLTRHSLIAPLAVRWPLHTGRRNWGCRRCAAAASTTLHLPVDLGEDPSLLGAAMGRKLVPRRSPFSTGRARRAMIRI